MTPELKRKWIVALRSGKYKQATGVLKNDEGFCCLGVLCDVEGAKWEKEIGGERFVTQSGEVTSLLLSHREHIGLDDSLHSELMMMNDGGETFETIAKFIEEKV